MNTVRKFSLIVLLTGLFFHRPLVSEVLRDGGGLPVHLVILGGTGDLSQRKLFPALYRLYQKNLLPEKLRITGVSAEDLTGSRYIQSLRNFSPGMYDKGDLPSDGFFRKVRYIRVNLKEQADFKALREMPGQGGQQSQDIYYMAVSSHLYSETLKNMAKNGMIKESSRFIFEKPIGFDQQSGRALLKDIRNHLKRDQIYLVDHYLSKEMIQNIITLRFANRMFSELWNRDHISHVEITVSEKLGVENRAAYYDRFGCLRDMVQSHLLQVLALTAMEAPEDLSWKSVSGEKVRVLNALKKISAEEMRGKVVFGRYERAQKMTAYTEEPGVDADRKTETFVALQAEVNSPRWTGVPFFLRTGKRMTNRYAVVVIHFRQSPHAHLFSSNRVMNGRLVINIQPEGSLDLRVNYQEDPLKDKIRFENLSAGSEVLKAGTSFEAYEKILIYAFNGQKEFFIEPEEAEAAWIWIDPVLSYFRVHGLVPEPYPAGSPGPLSADDLPGKFGWNWYDPARGKKG